jgi:hypothetical protein
MLLKDGPHVYPGIEIRRVIASAAKSFNVQQKSEKKAIIFHVDITIEHAIS